MKVEANDGFLDITGAREVEVQISAMGNVVWVHTNNTKLRICGIEKGVMVTDQRSKRLRDEAKAWHNRPFSLPAAFRKKKAPEKSIALIAQM